MNWFGLSELVEKDMDGSVFAVGMVRVLSSLVYLGDQTLRLYREWIQQ